MEKTSSGGLPKWVLEQFLAGGESLAAA